MSAPGSSRGLGTTPRVMSARSLLFSPHRPPESAPAGDWSLPLLGAGLSGGAVVSHAGSVTLSCHRSLFSGPTILLAHAEHPLWVLPQTALLRLNRPVLNIPFLAVLV